MSKTGSKIASKISVKSGGCKDSRSLSLSPVSLEDNVLPIVSGIVLDSRCKGMPMHSSASTLLSAGETPTA